MKYQPVGVFDSGYGGLTVLKEIVNQLPQYDYLYLGDNARAPYGILNFETVYQYTLQSVQWLFTQGCSLVILACNTASAKALRTIQQNDLPKLNNNKRVLGVIRPTTEIIGNFTKTKEIGILGTNGTIQSNSYPIEIKKFYPDIKVYQEACPSWVPLVENNKYNSASADHFVKKHIDHLLNQSINIDTLLLACTHFPLLIDKIKQIVPKGTVIVSQGEIVAKSLKDYLNSHAEIETNCSKSAKLNFYTTGSTKDFDNHAGIFFGKTLKSNHVEL